MSRGVSLAFLAILLISAVITTLEDFGILLPARTVTVNEHFRNMKRTKRQRFYGQRYTPQGYDYK